MEEFKECQNKGVGYGGHKCSCCNLGIPPEKARRRARRLLKQRTQKEIAKDEPDPTEE